MRNRPRILNPKRRSNGVTGRDEWFPYYAGFSGDFARELISSLDLPEGSTCMDPWNGSGTTTTAASLYKQRTLGYDVNPVMVAVARARLMPKVEVSSIVPLLNEIINKAEAYRSPCTSQDPLLIWFSNESACSVRSIERAVHMLLVPQDATHGAHANVSQFSAIASFFYLGLFRTVRDILRGFIPSNPTWVRKPKDGQGRVRPSLEKIASLFRRYAEEMARSISSETETWSSAENHCMIEIAQSSSLPVPSDSVDLVITSPPYCTRIDYAISTSPELAVLGLDFDEGMRGLRSRLIGTPTIHKTPAVAEPAWGTVCNSFLEQVRTHPSKAAESYYYKTFVQYVAGIDGSLKEVARCMKPKANCFIVVQDSFFKEVRADLPAMFAELCTRHGLNLDLRQDFAMSRTLISINTRSKAYRDNQTAVESVLSFTKQ